MSRIQLDVDRRSGHLVVRWSSARSSGRCRFDRVPGTSPEWLGAADELLEGAGRRDEQDVVAALRAWADDAGVELGIWHDDGGVESLSSGGR